jgi:hypothetical protein
MLPHERSLVKEKLKGRPFAIVGVNSDSKERLKELVADGTTLWRNFTNEQSYGKISTAWGVRGWPTLYLIDHNGVIKHKGLRGEAMEKAIMEMVDEAEKSR